MIDVNLKLWKIEDDIRDLERAKTFNQEFIELARQVYITNDERFKRKNTINTIYKSGLVEVKSYQVVLNIIRKNPWPKNYLATKSTLFTKDQFKIQMPILHLSIVNTKKSMEKNH